MGDPLWRQDALDTSVAAGQSINVTKLEDKVLLAIEYAGIDGMTADELRARMPELSYSSVTARPAALKRKGLIFDSGERRAGNSGRMQAVLKHIKYKENK